MTKRVFTAEEDLQIHAHARGEMPLYRLLQVLRTSREAVFRRAFELGLTIHIRSYRARRAPPPLSIPSGDGAAAYRINVDHLLMRLYRFHKERIPQMRD